MIKNWKIVSFFWTFQSGKREKEKNNSVLQTDYFSILNPFYIEKLSQEDINWLKEKKVADQEVLQLIERTYKNILKKEGVETVMYNPPLKEHAVSNGTLVLELRYGKNIRNLTGKDYVENMEKQRAFLEELTEQLEERIEEVLGMKGKISIEKVV